MPTTPAQPTSIGERIKARRELRGWSVRFLASRAGIASSTLSRIERGLRSADNRYLIADLAAALECSVLDLTGQPYAPADASLEAAQRAVPPLRRVLMEIDLEERPDSSTPGHVELVEQEATLVAELRRRCDYAGVTSRLPALLADLHAHATAGTHSGRALELLVHATNTAAFTLSRLGYPGDGYVAARLGHEAGRHLDDPIWQGIADFAYAHAAGGGGGAFRRMLTIADRACDRLAGKLGDVAALETYGMLRLTAASACLGLHDEARCREHLADAERIAARTGQLAGWSWFGPTNVGFWRVTMEVDTGNPGTAVEVANSLRPQEVDSPSRHVAFYIDLARALAHLRGKQRESVRALLAAERMAPQRTRSAPQARETARQLLDAARRQAGGSALRGLCERMGVPA